MWNGYRVSADRLRAVIGTWRSLVAHLLWEQGVAGSNPAVPTRQCSNRHEYRDPKEGNSTAHSAAATTDLVVSLRRLDLTASAAALAGALDWDHRDPFDRLLVAQVRQTGHSMLTADRRILALESLTIPARAQSSRSPPADRAYAGRVRRMDPESSMTRCQVTNPDDHAPPVTLARDGHIAVVTLDRADKLNAQTLAMWRQLAEIGAELVADDTVRVAVVRGAGRSFSAGLDLTDMATRLGSEAAGERSAEEAQQTGSWAQASTAWLAEAPFPTIAAVRGHAYGAGLQLALGADIRIASTTAKLAAMEAKYSLVPDMGAVEWLPRLIGPARAAEMIYFTKVVEADEAHRIGLVNQVVSDDELDDTVMAAATRLAQTAPRALRHAKALLRQEYLEPGTGNAASLVAQRQLIGSADFAEAIAAMLEKRPAKYT